MGINHSIASVSGDMSHHLSIGLKVGLVKRTGQVVRDHAFHGECNTEDVHALGHEDVDGARVGEDIVPILVVSDAIRTVQFFPGGRAKNTNCPG